jgi:hypothetical protein
MMLKPLAELRHFTLQRSFEIEEPVEFKITGNVFPLQKLLLW